ncbi:hypothetical protein SPFM14_00080 [Salmonella phage SPFM14]|nr:hypothetical protein SPFM14_00080 [Salmonella phage SPFM14]
MTQIFDALDVNEQFCLYRVIAGVLKIRTMFVSEMKLLAGNRACVALEGGTPVGYNHQRTILHIEKGEIPNLTLESSDLTEAQNKQLLGLHYKFLSQVKAHLGIQLMAEIVILSSAKLYR